MDKLNVVDSATVCSLLNGISDRTLRTWVSDLGCPSIKDGKTRTYEWPKVLEWYVSYAGAKAAGVAGDFAPDEMSGDPGEGENLTQANLRKIRAEADLKQLILAQKRGQVIGIADAIPILDRLFANLKSQLLGAAPLLNTRLESESDSIAREAAIRDFMENLCRELATGKIVHNAVAEAQPFEQDEASETDSETIDGLEASGDDITEDEVDAAVIEYLAAHAALKDAEHAG